MSPDEFQNDPLDVVLGGKDKASGDERLRQAVLASTLGVIRRRRRLKRCAMAATLMGCYLAGMATLAVWHQSRQENTSKPSSAQVATKEQSNTDVKPTLPPDFAGPPDQKAVYKVASKYDVLCRQAERYLHDPENLQLAVRTYSRALKYASADQRAVSPEHDTWLLMALKDAQTKETKHEHSQL